MNEYKHDGMVALFQFWQKHIGGGFRNQVRFAFSKRVNIAINRRAFIN